MDISQTMRRWWRKARAWLAQMRARIQASNAARRSDTGDGGAPLPRAEQEHPVRWGFFARIALIVLLVLLVVYPVTAWFYSHIDDDPNFAQTNNLPAGQSHAVAATIALLDLEVNKRDWAANDPFFWPTSLLDNMPNYQKGMVGALARFAFELTDQIGRARGSSEADPDLQTAAGLLQYPPDVWVWDPSVSFWPTATSEQQYRKAIKALRQYNTRLANGKAVFDTRTDNLQFTLDRIAADLGSSSAVIEAHVRQKSGFPLQNDTDDVFYTVKGQMYAYYIVLNALQKDFSSIIKQRELAKPWANMMASFRSGIALRPTIVLNGSPDSGFVPCHLCSEGFYLLRARTQMREITNILQQ